MAVENYTGITDREFARRFERGEIAPADFHHLEHLRLAWAYLGECASIEAASARMCQAIRDFATQAGSPGKYHETMTIFWVRLLAGAHACNADQELSAVLPAHAQFLDKDAPLRYYSHARLFSDAARAAWLPPDLSPLDLAAVDASSAPHSHTSTSSPQPCHSA